jgi:TRAP-type mannitol/chloroaromatic compound transport system permease small subunit
VRALLGVAASIDALGASVGRGAAWLSIPIVVVIVIDVVFRRFFAVGSVMLQELEWHFHAALFLLAAAWTYRQDAHVRIDVVHGRLGARARAWIETAGCAILLLPYCAVVWWLSIRFVLRSFEMGEVSDAPGGLGYRWVIKLAMPVGFGLLFLQGLSTLIRNVLFLTGRGDPGGAARA